MPVNERPNEELNDTIREILRRAYPKKAEMKNLINTELNKAMAEVSKVDGIYTLSKNLANTFLTTANLDLPLVQKFASFIPGGLVMSNPFYNTLLVYILTFCAAGEIDTVVYGISRYFTAIKLSYAKRKYFPSINADLLNYTLINAHGSTIAKQGWAALINKVAKETLEKYIDVMKTKVSLYTYYRYMVDIHNKINQSVKHIARRYYANSGKVVSNDEAERVNKAIKAKNTVFNSTQALDFISRNVGINEFEVERIITKLQRDEDESAGFQSMVATFIKQYKNREGINRTGLSIAAGRALLMNNVPQYAVNVLKEIGEAATKENAKVIIYVALLCVMYSE